MSVIGELAVNVVARTDKLTKGLKGARKQVAGMSKGFKSAAAGVTSFAKAAIGIGGGLGALGIAASMRTAAESIDKLAKSSQKLGIATEELAGLHVAAKRTGVEINQLEMGLQRMVRRVSEAAQGTGEAKDAIAELGIDARELNRLAPEKQFSLIAQRMSLVANQSDKIRLAFKLFDSEGVNLIRTLDLGAKGLEEMRAKAVALGLAVSSEDAKKVEEFNNAIADLKDFTSGVGNTLTIAIAPTAVKFMEGIQALLTVSNDRNLQGKTEPGFFDALKINRLDAQIGKKQRRLRGARQLAEESPWAWVRGVAKGDIAELPGQISALQKRRRELVGDVHGVALRPGEVMSPELANRLVTVNEEQLRQARESNAKLLAAMKEAGQKQREEEDKTIFMIP